MKINVGDLRLMTRSGFGPAGKAVEAFGEKFWWLESFPAVVWADYEGQPAWGLVINVYLEFPKEQQDGLDGSRLYRHYRLVSKETGLVELISRISHTAEELKTIGHVNVADRVLYGLGFTRVSSQS